MKKPSTVSVVALSNILDTFQKLGGEYNREAALKKYNLPLDIFDDETNRIPIQVVYDTAANTTSQLGPLAGLRISQNMDFARWSWFQDLFFAARTVREALEIFARYFHIYTELGSVELASSEAGWRCYFRPTDPELISYHQLDGSMMFLFKYAKMLGGEGFTAIDLAHECPEACVDEYASAFNIPVSFNGEVPFFSVDGDWLDRELKDFDNPSYQKLGAAEIRLAKVRGEKNIEEQVVFILRKMLISGDVSIKRISESLGMSQRTFQRRLKDRELVYQDILESTRKDLAIEYLKDSDRYVNEIAFLVGYNDIRYFFRAFRHWTGMSPGQYREALTLMASS